MIELLVAMLQICCMTWIQTDQLQILDCSWMEINVNLVQTTLKLYILCMILHLVWSTCSVVSQCCLVPWQEAMMLQLMPCWMTSCWFLVVLWIDYRNWTHMMHRFIEKLFRYSEACVHSWDVHRATQVMCCSSTWCFASLSQAVLQLLAARLRELSGVNDSSYTHGCRGWQSRCNASLPDSGKQMWDVPLMNTKSEAVMSAVVQNQADRAWLIADSSSHAGDFLNTIPNSAVGTRMDNNELCVAVALQPGYTYVCGEHVESSSTYSPSSHKSAGCHYHHNSVIQLISIAEIPMASVLRVWQLYYGREASVSYGTSHAQKLSRLATRAVLGAGTVASTLNQRSDQSIRHFRHCVRLRRLQLRCSGCWMTRLQTFFTTSVSVLRQLLLSLGRSCSWCSIWALLLSEATLSVSTRRLAISTLHRLHVVSRSVSALSVIKLSDNVFLNKIWYCLFCPLWCFRCNASCSTCHIKSETCNWSSRWSLVCQGYYILLLLLLPLLLLLRLLRQWLWLLLLQLLLLRLLLRLLLVLLLLSFYGHSF